MTKLAVIQLHTSTGFDRFFSCSANVCFYLLCITISLASDLWRLVNTVAFNSLIESNLKHKRERVDAM